ncbi:hypothetical protein C1H46_045614 [Malus baccata]|uniref:Uncharacterized protein n=1 Tax=Malus baccata TaxID=106549 RepID=A0A540K3P6_MALBA|nr:hypothetical protein C1H46_045614 [Malus baccata]
MSHNRTPNSSIKHHSSSHHKSKEAIWKKSTSDSANKGKPKDGGGVTTRAKTLLTFWEKHNKSC